MPVALEDFIERSHELHEAVGSHVAGLQPYPTLRFEIASQAGRLALEHGNSSLMLMSNGLMASAFALLRPQFECLVRGFWLAYAASDEWVIKLAQPLTVLTARRAGEGPMLAEMFKHLEHADEAPRPIVAQLQEYREVTWKALNSFSHGGIHPLSKFVSGYSPQLTYDSLRNANAVLAVTCQFLSVMTGDSENMIGVRRIHEEFADCLPILKTSGAQEVSPRGQC
jgi:hypothetical protein